MTYGAPQELHLGVEGLWSHDQVTPARDEHRRLFDATRLSFPLQMVILSCQMGLLSQSKTV